MTTQDTGSEQLIKDTAKHIFFAEGRLHATTQDIADAAGVNRTLLNYYFRLRNEPMDQVFKEARQSMDIRLDALLLKSGIPFKKRVDAFINQFITETSAYPFMETFVLIELRRNNLKLIKKFSKARHEEFTSEVKVEMDKGTIPAMNPIHFVMNLFSLLAHPALMKPLYTELFGLSDTAYQQLIDERKQIVLKLLFTA